MSKLFFLALIVLTFTSNAQITGCVQGIVTDDNDEPLPFVCVRLDSTKIGSYSDVDGFYKIVVEPGQYTLVAECIGFTPVRIDSVIIQGEKILSREIQLNEKALHQIETVKPIIYLYPEDTTDVHVSIEYKGDLTTTYPKYPENGWDVTALPNGDLIDAKDKTYYALYWEGEPTTPLTIQEGTIVERDHTIRFLEDKLSQLGLNQREANEFIVYWLPILEKNPYNVISFSFESYEELAHLQISPKPDQLFRVMMLYQGLKIPLELPEQVLPIIDTQRKGFTVVEWGGQEANIITL